MIRNVIVNYPEDKAKLQDILSKELAKILVKKLRPHEIDKLIEILSSPDCKLTL